MTTRDVTLLLAMLAVVAEAGVAVALIVVIGGRWSARLAGWRDSLVDLFGPVALQLALGVALVATLGSLYLSEVANFPPCRLCWYQRIAMYPLVPILAVAIWRRDAGVRFYALPLALVGGLISTYHVVLERYPSLESGVCEVANPCTLIWVRRFGYLTIPTMALSAFALIAVLLLAAGADERAAAGDAGTESEAETEELEAA
ncbi:MAG TPA: disulfide bond formation protein B [Acidimicrobiales bacterium]|nr:disulfide bond formation protein B [Acidimicrobiales bacterium]